MNAHLDDWLKFLEMFDLIEMVAMMMMAMLKMMGTLLLSNLNKYNVFLTHKLLRHHYYMDTINMCIPCIINVSDDILLYNSR